MAAKRMKDKNNKLVESLFFITVFINKRPLLHTFAQLQVYGFPSKYYTLHSLNVNVFYIYYEKTDLRGRFFYLLM